ncbi:thioredoxin-like protein 4B isoform X2 [Sycon ciliatum]|uniref:thioredoxin-like protein 4B isoform X2 n=1 Tax=Sycon ciliatum TaxID=27933 RepID=UPI0020ADE58F|eukprot:scpid72370/ scgid18629/ Thioredoxin-like protein 4B; Dim1-like protein
MAFSLKQLSSKAEVDAVIKTTLDKVLVLRFGRASDVACMQLDDILDKAQEKMARMAEIYTVDVDAVPIYVHYFDISLIPATVFFFNAQHMKVDYGTPDHTKFIGAFKKTQDFIDLVEVILRGALHGKVMVTSPIDPRNVPKYDLVYKNI